MIHIVKDYGEPSYYFIEAPLHEKKTCKRTKGTVTLRLPHEALFDDYTPDESQTEEFWESCPSFGKSDAVRACLDAGFSKTDIIPISLYYDGVQYSNNDSFLGYYVQNLLTRQKYLIAAIRRGLSLA
jgi:hypothetical protein